MDLYISTFGPVLAIISESWPVLTSDSDDKGDPLPLKPGDALDLARQEVINLRKQGLLLGRSVEFDPLTDWYLMAWDAFRAQQFPADEARKLAIALRPRPGSRHRQGQATGDQEGSECHPECAEGPPQEGHGRSRGRIRSRT